MVLWLNEEKSSVSQVTETRIVLRVAPLPPAKSESARGTWCPTTLDTDQGSPVRMFGSSYWRAYVQRKSVRRRGCGTMHHSKLLDSEAMVVVLGQTGSKAGTYGEDQ